MRLSKEYFYGTHCQIQVIISTPLHYWPRY